MADFLHYLLDFIKIHWTAAFFKKVLILMVAFLQYSSNFTKLPWTAPFYISFGLISSFLVYSALIDI